MMKNGDSTTIDVPETAARSTSSKGKSPAVMVAAPLPRPGGWKKGIAIFDFVLRIFAMACALAGAAAMGTSDQTIPFFTQLFQFQASYDDLPTLQYVNLTNNFLY